MAGSFSKQMFVLIKLHIQPNSTSAVVWLDKTPENFPWPCCCPGPAPLLVERQNRNSYCLVMCASAGKLAGVCVCVFSGSACGASQLLRTYQCWSTIGKLLTHRSSSPSFRCSSRCRILLGLETCSYASRWKCQWRSKIPARGPSSSLLLLPAPHTYSLERQTRGREETAKFSPDATHVVRTTVATDSSA